MISHINLDIQKLKMFRLFPSDTCASDKDVNILHHHVNLDNSESIHAKQNIKRRKVILKIKYLNLGKRWFLSCHKHGTKQIFWVPMRNGTSDLWIQCFNALPLSYRLVSISARLSIKVSWNHLWMYSQMCMANWGWERWTYHACRPQMGSISATYTTAPRPLRAEQQPLPTW